MKYIIWKQKYLSATKGISGMKLMEMVATKVIP
jgi:hypothetical protein